ncbi:hypothetical protein PIROE2DRAFT_6835, partial [Piromyces sp. E2]
QDGRPDVRILPFAGFIQFKCCTDGKLENQDEDSPKHVEIPFITVDDMFLPAKDKLLNSLLFKVDTRSDFLTNILKGSKFTEVCWFLPYTKEEFRLCGSFHTSIISPTTTGKNYAPTGKPFCNTNSYNINWELLRKMVWNQMPEKEKKIYLNYNNKHSHSNINDLYNRESYENTYDFDYNVSYQYSTTTSPGHSRRNSISRKNSNLSMSRKSSIKRDTSYKSQNKILDNNNDEFPENNINDECQDNQLEPKPYLSKSQISDKYDKDRNTYAKDVKEKDDDNYHYHYSSSSTKHSIYIEKTNVTKYDRNNNKVDQKTEINIHRKNSKIKTIVKSKNKDEHKDANLNVDDNKKIDDNINKSDSSLHDSTNFTTPIQNVMDKKNEKDMNRINKILQDQFNKEDENRKKYESYNINNTDNDFLFEVEPYLMDLYFQDDKLLPKNSNKYLKNEKNNVKNHLEDQQDQSRNDKDKKNNNDNTNDHSQRLIVNNVNDTINNIKENKLAPDNHQNKTLDYNDLDINSTYN